jgi:hypothetical protein
MEDEYAGKDEEREEPGCVRRRRGNGDSDTDENGSSHKANGIEMTVFEPGVRQSPQSNLPVFVHSCRLKLTRKRLCVWTRLEISAASSYLGY